MEWPDGQNVLSFFEAAETILTVLAIIIGAIWTYKLFRQKRQKYPRADISHHFVELPITADQKLLRVTARIENKGDVLLRIISGEVWILLVCPWPSRVLAALSNDNDLVAPNKLEIDWPLIAERKAESMAFEVEPGETDEIHFDLVLRSEVESILAYTHFKNEAKRARFRFWRKRKIGWNTTTFHDLHHEAEERLAMSDKNKQGKPDGTKQGPRRERPVIPDPRREQIQAPQRERPQPDDTADRLRSEDN